MTAKTSKNQTTSSRIMIQCRTTVNRDAVRRESIDGVEHIIVSSSTLPDDIVMNGGLYPAAEIAASFESLELTLAPVEHPSINGQFISATDPRAIHDFHAGAFNMNVRRENGRVHVDKYINVAEAMKTDRGKRLLDRIEELETNDKARPIHTSVGVFLIPVELDAPKVNAQGDEYTWEASEMVFDHDAILLDSIGAAQPHQGVGVAVNSEGDEFRVDQIELEAGVDADEVTDVRAAMSFDDIHNALVDALERSATDVDFIDNIYPFGESVIFNTKDQSFEVPFVIDAAGLATIVGIPLPVERSVTFTPKTNHLEGEAMKELILNALKEAKVETEGLSDGQLFEAFQGLQANQSDSDDAGKIDHDGIAEIVANAMQPITASIEGLQAKLNSADDAEVTRLSGVVANSDKYPGFDVETAKLLGVEKLKELAANCETAHGVPGLYSVNSSEQASDYAPKMGGE